MLDLNQKNFPHRTNRDGSHDSICPHCFRTVATRRDEAELPDEEQKHVCTELHLDRSRIQETQLHAQTH